MYKQPRNTGNPTSGLVVCVVLFVCWVCLFVFSLKKYYLVFALAVIFYHLGDPVMNAVMAGYGYALLTLYIFQSIIGSEK